VDDAALLSRITSNPDIFAGKPIIRGHRLAVEHVLRYLAAGQSNEELQIDFPWLEKEDIQACLLYALRAYQTLANDRIETIRLDHAS
jgi:uncharacterized protein (DUF433 family)